MSLAGFKKQINKANQFMNEKIAGAKGTELDDDFLEMEKKIDSMEKLIHEMVTKTNELLQPNPASRAKMAASKGISKLKGQTSQSLYPQPEGVLGECMIKYGRELGNDSCFGQALTESGEAFKQLAEVKYTLEDSVKQNFLEPLHHLENKDLKEVNFHRKKLTGRRLDYDCKKRKQTKDGTSVTDDEMRSAEDKFEESKQLAETAMVNLLENDVEHIFQLSAFVEAELSYFQNSVDILSNLVSVLRTKSSEAGSRPRTERVLKPALSYSSSRSSRRSNTSFDMNQSDYSVATSPTTPSPKSNGRNEVSAEALFDFEPENEGELGFRAGDIIRSINRVDENWLEGTVNSQTGYFPISYVQVNGEIPD